MHIEIHETGFEQAIALMEDTLFLARANQQDPRDLKVIKLIKAREANPDFELELAVMICGEPGTNFPYRSSYFLTKFFHDLGLHFTHGNETRRFWVQSVLQRLPTPTLLTIIERGLFSKKDFRKAYQERKFNSEEEMLQKAMNEFKLFIQNSLHDESYLDVTPLLDLNINVELLFSELVATSDSELNDLMREAKTRFFHPKDKQVSVEKLWDAFERVKTYFGNNKKESASALLDVISQGFSREVLQSEFEQLTRIGNEFRIRHHETNKMTIADDRHLNYLFFRMLALLDLCLTSIGRMSTSF